MFEVAPTTTETIELPVLAQPRPFFSGRMPLPPSVNAAYQVVKDYDQHHRVRGTRIGPTPELTRFKENAAMMLVNAYHDWSLINAIRASKRKVPLAVKLQVYFATEWKRDLDGVIKFAIDAAFERMQLNDNQVVDIQVEKCVDPVQPCVEIEVRCLVGR